jgi:hypothetical protein
MIKMKVKKGTTSVSFNGDEYPVENGHVTVPPSAVEHLEAHGHTVPEEAGKHVDLSDDDNETETDDDTVDDDDAAELDPKTMTKDEMVTFLKARGVPVAAGLTKAELREMVVEALADAKE